MIIIIVIITIVIIIIIYILILLFNYKCRGSPVEGGRERGRRVCEEGGWRVKG